MDRQFKSKKRFTFNIITSYVVLGGLAVLAAFFIYGEFKNYTASQDTEGERDKLLRTNKLLTQLYEAENSSRRALQTKNNLDLQAYVQRVDSINGLIDSLKPLTLEGNGIRTALDSVQVLLRHKVQNNAELRKLRAQVDNRGSYDSVLEAINRMELDMGRITPEALVPDFDKLPPSIQKPIRDYAAFYNQNIPETDGAVAAKNIDSILEISKSILNRAKAETAAIERSMMQKELQIYRTDLELSQKIRNVISGFEHQMIQNAYMDSLNQEEALRRSSRLAAAAILLGLLIVISFTFLISRDYWKAQQYREQLEKEKKYSEFLLKSREQLIATVSHDLRTPLTTIGGYSELMQHSGLTDKQLSYLKNVKSASGYVENLVNELLDYSKLEAGKMKLETLPFVLANLIRETSMNFGEVNPKKGVELVLDIDPILERPILSDPFRIRQVLTNLVGNAFKFTEKGQVKISAQLEDKGERPWIRIRVSDTGVGIAPEKRELIFQEFVQGGEATQKKYGGYGLGLTISKKLTELLGGNLFLESEQGQGSSFTFRIPVSFAELPAPKSEEDLPLGPMELYVVDDDPTLLELLRELCKINDIKVRTFTDFKELQKEGTPGADLVLTDMQMPEIDGFGVLKKLRELGYDKPVIAMTGQKVTDPSSYTRAGFDAVLQKPFSSTAFLETLGRTHGADQRPSPPSALPAAASEHFDLGNLSLFLDGPQALQEILETFLGNTRENLGQLVESAERGDCEGVREIAHKMLPMFRQLEARGSIPILEELEQLPDGTDPGKLSAMIAGLKGRVKVLLAVMEDYLLRLQVDID